MRQSAHSGVGASTGKKTGGSGQVAAVHALGVNLSEKPGRPVFPSYRFRVAILSAQERLPDRKAHV